jgi:hypothetical protein
MIRTLPPVWRNKPPQNSIMLGRATGPPTITVAKHVPVPLPVAVMVYTVETEGDTDVVPPAVGVTVPIP